MTDLIIVLGATTLVAIVFHAWKVPPMVAFFTAGALVGPHGLALIHSPPQVKIMTEGAGLLLMFTIGLEFSLQKLMAFRRSLLFIGAGQVVLTAFLFTVVFTGALGYPIEKSIFLSFIVSLSSTAVVTKLLSDRRDLETPHGMAALSILLSQDIAVIPMIVAIPFLRSIHNMSSGFLESLFPVLLLGASGLAILYVVNRYILPPLLFRVAQTKNHEVFFFSIVFFVAIVAFAVHSIGLSVSLGAFIAGMLIAGSAYGKQATSDFLPLRDAFLSLFFVTVGMLLDVKFVVMHFPMVILIGLIVLTLKAFVIFTVVWMSGNSGTVARIVALLVFQTGEFSFILADQGLKLNLMSEVELQYFIAISILSLGATPFVYRWLPQLSQSDRFRHMVPLWIEQRAVVWRRYYMRLLKASVDLEVLAHSPRPRPEVIIIGFGVAGRSLAKVLKALKIQYAIIETNRQTVVQFRGHEPSHYGDASSTEILESCGIDDAKLVAIVTSSVTTLEPVIRAVRELRPSVPIIARTNYLLDVNRFREYKNIDMVISEFETTIEVISRALKANDVDPMKIETFTAALRAELGTTGATT